MGGTFNPIHLGHLMLAECAREELLLEEVWFIPTGCSYMKTERQNGTGAMPSPRQRLEMTELALKSNKRFCCLDIEINREGSTYSYETLEELGCLYPGHRFYFILGADCLYTIDSWREPARIFAACDIVAAVRGDSPLEEMEAEAARLREKYGARITLLPFRNLEISSTEIRERVRNGKGIRYMTPENVIAYIEEKGFYCE